MPSDEAPISVGFVTATGTMNIGSVVAAICASGFGQKISATNTAVAA